MSHQLEDACLPAQRMHGKTFLGCALVLAVALAGCTGNFNVRQTEPLRIALEGGGGGGGGTSSTSTLTVHVDEQASRSQTIEVTKANTTETMVVNVVVHAAAANGTSAQGNATGNGTGANATVSTQQVVVNIVVQTRGGETLGQQQVQAAPGASGTANLNVNVKGKDNVVIVTQAVQGAADVDVAAHAG
jgi:hypothetical protein